jgi:predicted nicotinamide N-methyase
MAKKKKREKRVERQAYGLKVLKAVHPLIRHLKSEHDPSIHGNKFWNSSWAIMDYLEYQGLPLNSRVLEAGCGWGLAGIYCARKYGAKVTGLDADPAVFPYLELHALINEVAIDTWQCKFEEVKKKDLAQHDLLIGADICFWDEMVEPVYKLVKKAVEAGVGQVIVADPGRPPFHQMSERCVEKLGGEIKEWDVEGPVKVSAYLLIVGSLL